MKGRSNLLRRESVTVNNSCESRNVFKGKRSPDDLVRLKYIAVEGQDCPSQRTVR